MNVLVNIVALKNWRFCQIEMSLRIEKGQLSDMCTSLTFLNLVIVVCFKLKQIFYSHRAATKMTNASKVAKSDMRITISLHYSKSVTHSLGKYNGLHVTIQLFDHIGVFYYSDNPVV